MQLCKQEINHSIQVKEAERVQIWFIKFGNWKHELKPRAFLQNT